MSPRIFTGIASLFVSLFQKAIRIVHRCSQRSQSDDTQAVTSCFCARALRFSSRANNCDVISARAFATRCSVVLQPVHHSWDVSAEICMIDASQMTPPPPPPPPLHASLRGTGHQKQPPAECLKSRTNQSFSISFMVQYVKV
jgi:hypothetical protein